MPERRIAIAMKMKALKRLEDKNLHLTVEEKKISILSDVSDFAVSHVAKDKETGRMILKALKKNILFNNYSEARINLFLRALKPRKTKKNEVIITEGDHGHNFYVINSGRFKFSKKNDDSYFKIEERETCFGELSLLFDTPRYLTVTSIDEGEVFFLNRPIFQAILDEGLAEKRLNAFKVLSKLDILKDFSDERKLEIVEAGHLQVFNEGDTIIKKDEESCFFYFVINGKVKVVNFADESANGVSTEFKKGNYFGESALADTNKKRTADVVACSKTELLILDKVAIVDKLGKIKLMNVLNRNFEERFLNSVFLFNVIKENVFKLIRKCVLVCTYNKGKKVIKVGEKVEFLYIIKSGSVTFYNKKTNQSWFNGTGSVFGLNFLINDKKSDVSVTVDEEESCELFKLEKEVFINTFSSVKNYKEEFLNGESDNDGLSVLTQLLKTSKRSTRRTGSFQTVSTQIQRITGINSTTEDGMSRKSTQIRHFQLTDFTQIQVLGTGAFGVVRLVQHESLTYALKAVDIETLIRKNLQHTVSNEKEILLKCNHPFILQLFGTFKDFSNFYFVFETLLGGDLFTYLYDTRTCHTCEVENLELIEGKCDYEHDPVVPVNEAVFYTGCVTDAFDYLQTKKIVYRDLKPENLMIDESGYLKLVDFGFAKVLKNHRSFTMCGTHDYMPPEMMLKQGHNRSVDLWTLGVLTYELLVGRPPFSKSRGASDRDHMTSFRNVTKVKYKLNQVQPKEAREFIDSLLKRDPLERLGMRRYGLKELKDHDFYKTLDFKKLRAKDEEIIVPFSPNIEDKTDTRFFDPTVDKELGSSMTPSTEPTLKQESMVKKAWYVKF